MLSSFRVRISIVLRFSSLSSVAVNSILYAGFACNCSCGKFFKIEMRVVLSQVLNLSDVISSGNILLDKSSTLNSIPAEKFQQRICSRINLLWRYKRYKTIQIDDSSQLEGYVWMPKTVILINQHVVWYGGRYAKKAIAKEGKFKARLGGRMRWI